MIDLQHLIDTAPHVVWYQWGGEIGELVRLNVRYSDGREEVYIGEETAYVGPGVMQSYHDALGIPYTPLPSIEIPRDWLKE